MLYILAGFFLAMANVAVATLLSQGMEVSAYFDIKLACALMGESQLECVAGASWAGYTLLVGLAVSTIIAVAFFTRLPHFSPAEARPSFCVLAPVLALAVVGAHFLHIIFVPLGVSRIDAITAEAPIISLANLVWPILLFAVASSKNARDVLLYGGLLLMVIAIIPYRAVLVAVFVFGLLLPLLQRNLRRQEGRTAELAKGSGKHWIMIIVLAMAVVISTLYMQTKERVTNVQTTGGEGNTAAGLQIKLIQRTAYPLFQAHLAEQLALATSLPSVADEILKKFRLSQRPNLNEYLYAQIYGAGTVGETTSMFYGEAVANSNAHPMIWVVVAPLLLCALWAAFAMRGMDVGPLIGLAIWRGSLGGLAGVLPALLIQLAVVGIFWIWMNKKAAA